MSPTSTFRLAPPLPPRAEPLSPVRSHGPGAAPAGYFFSPKSASRSFMHSTCCRITPRLLKKVFFLVCISCVFLLGFYLYYEKYDDLIEFAKLQARLHPQIFHNTSRTRQPDFCLSEQNGAISALIFVISDSRHRLWRQMIRRSWANPKVLANLHFGVLFVVDDVKNDLESETFGDLIRVNRVDVTSYGVQKTMLSFQWALDNCPAVKFIIKTEDDIFINPFTLQKLLQGFGPPSPSKSSNKNQPTQLNIKATLDFTLFDQSLQETSTDNNLAPIRQDTRDLKFVIPRHIDPKKHIFNKISESLYGVQLESYDLPDNTDDMSHENFVMVNRDRTVICSVRKNTTLIRDANAKLDLGKGHLKPQDVEAGHLKEEDFHQTYCSGGAYILPIPAVKLLVEAHLKKLPSNLLPTEDIYITGVLAKEAALDHFQINSRYTLKSVNIETIANGRLIFARLGKDVETLTNLIWNRIVESRENNEF